MPSPKPTETELAILRVLWELGPSTVKQVHQALDREGELGYTATLKLMQTMHDKGLLRRDESQRAHRYTAVEARRQTQKTLLGDFVERVFSGSGFDLVQMALQHRKLSAQERSELQALLHKEKP